MVTFFLFEKICVGMFRRQILVKFTSSWKYVINRTFIVNRFEIIGNILKTSTFKTRHKNICQAGCNGYPMPAPSTCLKHVLLNVNSDYLVARSKSDSLLPQYVGFICFNESHFKMIEIPCYFILKTFFVLKIIKLLS